MCRYQGSRVMILLISFLTLGVAESALESAFVGVPSGTFVSSYHRPGAPPRWGAVKSLASSSASSHRGHDVKGSAGSRHTRPVAEPMLREGETGGGLSRAGFIRDLVSSAALACAAGTVVAAASGGPGIRAAVADDGTTTSWSATTAPSTSNTLRQDDLERRQRSLLHDHLPPMPTAATAEITTGAASPLVVAGEGNAETASESAVSGLVAGAAVSTAKQILLYPVDTVKTRLQVNRGSAADGEPQQLFRGLYDGVLTPLLVGAPSGAVFFAAKDSFSTAIANMIGGGYADWTTVAAVGLAQIPYWGIRSPADLLKTRSQAGVSQRPGGGIAAAKEIVSEEGVQGLYTGYASNVAYAFPADAVKFLIYGALKRSAKKAKGVPGAKLGTVEAAVLGSGASMVAQAITTPLDVVRTRIMAASGDDRRYEGGVTDTLATIAREEGPGALFAGITPRVARSILSGAVQFGSYEFVKGLFGVEPRKL